MAGKLKEEMRKYFSPAIEITSRVKYEYKLGEYSILFYIIAFIALNLTGTTMMSSTGWTVYEPYNPSPSNETVLLDDSPQISAAYWDEDADDGTLRFYNSNGNLINSCSVSNGSRCGVEWSAASPHDNYWYAVAEDDTGDTAGGPWWFFQINDRPNTVSSPDKPADGSTVYDDNATLKVTVSDPNGDDLNVEFLNNVSNASTSERTIYGVSSGSQAEYNMDVTRGKTYKWWVRVSDQWHTTKSGSWSFYVNSLPSLQSVQPFDGSVHTKTDVILNATASDPEQDSLSIYFYDMDGNFLGKETGTDGEKLSSDEWSGLELGNTYSWKMNVSDGYGNATYLPFSFITSASEDYRVDHTIGIEYSSIITSTDSPKVFLITVENKVSTEKDMITYLTGVNAYFNENGDDSYSYTLEPYGTEEMMVTLEATSPDPDAELRVTSENTRIGINTTKSIPVTVREVPQVADTRAVPGITSIHLLAIMLLSVLLYYPRL